MSTLRLYSRDYCHLCHDMLDALQALRGEMGLLSLDIEVIDVDADPALVARYDELVPVLVDDSGTELCHYHLVVPKVREYLDGLR